MNWRRQREHRSGLVFRRTLKSRLLTGRLCVGSRHTAMPQGKADLSPTLPFPPYGEQGEPTAGFGFADWQVQ